MASDLLLTPRERARLDKVKLLLSQGKSPYEGLSVMGVGIVEVRKEKPKQVKTKIRLKRWRESNFTHPIKLGIVKREKLDNSTCLRCGVCGNETEVMKSVRARVPVSFGSSTLLNPNSLNNPTEYLERSGNILHVDTQKTVKFAKKVIGRVCKGCKGLIDPKDIIAECDFD